MKGNATFTCVRVGIVSPVLPRFDGGSRGVDVAEVWRE